MSSIDQKSLNSMSTAEIVHENGHRFVDTTQLGLRHKGECCLDCGNMRRADGKNSQCKGKTQIALRENASADALGFALVQRDDLLAEIESLRIKLANSEQENQRLRAGECICQRCGLRKDADKPAGEVPF